MNRFYRIFWLAISMAAMSSMTGCVALIPAGISLATSGVMINKVAENSGTMRIELSGPGTITSAVGRFLTEAQKLGGIEQVRNLAGAAVLFPDSQVIIKMSAVQCGKTVCVVIEGSSSTDVARSWADGDHIGEVPRKIASGMSGFTVIASKRVHPPGLLAKN